MGGGRFTEHRDRVHSRAGGWTIGGEATLYGYNIHQELAPKASWMQTMILATTGRLYPRNESRLIEAMFVTTGYPDPRLWCNRVAAFAGASSCAPSAALATGIASADARLFGGQTEYQAARIIQRAKVLMEKNGEAALKKFIDSLLKRYRCVYGFGRPLTKVEERIAPIEAMAKRLGIGGGPHLKTARLIERMLARRRLIMNFGGYVMARLLDLDFSPIEIYRVLVLGFYIGLIPCYTEAFDNEPGTFLPIACEDILYEGVGERPLP